MKKGDFMNILDGTDEFYSTIKNKKITYNEYVSYVSKFSKEFKDFSEDKVKTILDNLSSVQVLAFNEEELTRGRMLDLTLHNLSLKMKQK